MKQLFGKIFKRFSQIRDYLIMAIVAGGILFIMQSKQAVSTQNPVEIWQKQYETQVRAPTPAAQPGGFGGPGAVPGAPGAMPGTPGAMPGTPGAVGAPGGGAAAGNGGGDIVTGSIDFTPIPFDEVGPVSYHPIFTPAPNFSQLLKRLETLKTGYQDAIKEGNTKAAIEMLTDYSKHDPKGKLLEWSTPPEELLRNLVCSEISRSISETAKQGESALEEAGQSGGDLMKSIESLDSTITQIERTVQEAETNQSCLEGTDVSQAQITSLQDTRDRLLQARENLNKTLVLQRYEEVVRYVSAISADSEPEQVSQAITSLNQFEKILDDRNEDYLTQSQFDRLNDLKANLDKNKEEIVKRVRQEVARLATDDATGRDIEKIREILRLYDVLEVLKVTDGDIARERRRWDSTLSKLEASEAVKDMREKLREVRAAIESAQSDIAQGRTPQDFQSTISEQMAEIQGIQRRTKDIRRVPGYGELRSEYNELSTLIKRLNARITSLQN